MTLSRRPIRLSSPEETERKRLLRGRAASMDPSEWPTDEERAVFSDPGQLVQGTGQLARHDMSRMGHDVSQSNDSADFRSLGSVEPDQRDPFDGCAGPPSLDRPMCPFREEMARDPSTAPWSCGCGEVLGWLWAGGTRLGIMDPATGDVFVVVEQGGRCDVVCAVCRTGSSRRVG